MANGEYVVAVPSLNEQEKDHIKVMVAIVRAMKDTPLVLKGGTALLLACDLDRFSEDLDFDCSKRISLEAKVKAAFATLAGFKILQSDPKKDKSETAYKLLVRYQTPNGENRLKIEVSLRDPRPGYRLHNGMRIYDVPTLIDLKIGAFEDRTAARDLYDLNFLIKNFNSEFTQDHVARLWEQIKDIDQLNSRFAEAFEEDTILSSLDDFELEMELHERVRELLPTEPEPSSSSGSNFSM